MFFGFGVTRRHVPVWVGIGPVGPGTDVSAHGSGFDLSFLRGGSPKGSQSAYKDHRVSVTDNLLWFQVPNTKLGRFPEIQSTRTPNTTWTRYYHKMSVFLDETTSDRAGWDTITNGWTVTKERKKLREWTLGGRLNGKQKVEGRRRVSCLKKVSKMSDHIKLFLYKGVSHLSIYYSYSSFKIRIYLKKKRWTLYTLLRTLDISGWVPKRSDDLPPTNPSYFY